MFLTLYTSQFSMSSLIIFGLNGCHHQGRISLANTLGSIQKERSINLDQTKTQEAHTQTWYFPLGGQNVQCPDYQACMAAVQQHVTPNLGYNRLKLKPGLCSECVKNESWSHQPLWPSDTSSTTEFLRLSLRIHNLCFVKVNVFYKSMS